MLTPEQTKELRSVLEADLTRLGDHAHTALEFTMDRDRDRIGRDSMDESTEEEMYSTQLRLHDRETFLLGKIQEAMRRLDAGEIAPVIQLAPESRLPWVDDLPGLPTRSETEAAKVAGFYASIVSHQHPDHDTERWPRTAGALE